MHTSTKAEMLVMIGSVVVEIFKGKEAHSLRQYILYVYVIIFSKWAAFCCVVSKVQISHTLVSGVTAPKFAIFVHDVEGSFALLNCLSILRYSTPF